MVYRNIQCQHFCATCAAHVDIMSQFRGCPDCCPWEDRVWMSDPALNIQHHQFYPFRIPCYVLRLESGSCLWSAWMVESNSRNWWKVPVTGNIAVVVIKQTFFEKRLILILLISRWNQLLWLFYKHNSGNPQKNGKGRGSPLTRSVLLFTHRLCRKRGAAGNLHGELTPWLLQSLPVVCRVFFEGME